jgi:hypothetical protein
MMMPCLVMGDSIAVGVAEYRPECESVAKSGITSTRYIETLLEPHIARTIVISLGVNDDETVDTLDNLREVRRNLHAQTVYWLLPGIKPRARTIIETVAREFGDHLIDTKAQAGPDHLHPTGAGYQYLAALTASPLTPLTPPAQPIPRSPGLPAVHYGQYIRPASPAHPGERPVHPGERPAHPGQHVAHPAERVAHPAQHAAHPAQRVAHAGQRGAHPDQSVSPASQHAARTYSYNAAEGD